MRRQPDRTSYDPHQSPIEGLLSDPDRHISPGSSDTVEGLASAAIDAAFGLGTSRDQFKLGDDMFTTRQRGEALREGVGTADTKLDKERGKIIDAKLGQGVHPNSPAMVLERAKWQSEALQRESTIPNMEQRILKLQADRMAPGANPMETEEEINLKQQLAMSKRRIAALHRDIAKSLETEDPTPDPFTSAKLRQEKDRLDGNQPKARKALRHEVTTQGLTGFINPRVWADGARAFRRVRADRGLSPRQQRRSDRARIARGDMPINGTGMERPILDKVKKSKEKKDDEKARETSYSKIARVGQVLDFGDGELMVIQDVQTQPAYITAPDGSEQPLTYPDGTPVAMDDLADALLRKAGQKPSISRIETDPVTGLSTPREVPLDTPNLLESVHKGEELVKFGQLHTREEAKKILLEGGDEFDLAPLYWRLDDLIFGRGGDPDKKVRILKERDRLRALKTHLVWQRTEQKPEETEPPVETIKGNIQIFEGHDGHFVVPFTYPEQRRQTYLDSIATSRVEAARATRDAESRPPKGGLRDDRKPYYRGPRKRKSFWG